MFSIFIIVCGGAVCSVVVVNGGAFAAGWTSLVLLICVDILIANALSHRPDLLELQLPIVVMAIAAVLTSGYLESHRGGHQPLGDAYVMTAIIAVSAFVNYLIIKWAFGINSEEYPPIPNDGNGMGAGQHYYIHATFTTKAFWLSFFGLACGVGLTWAFHSARSGTRRSW